jgi:hypothetical protein
MRSLNAESNDDAKELQLTDIKDSNKTMNIKD